MYACRSDGVKCVGFEAAAGRWRKRISAEWCGLGAVGEHIPPREVHFVVHPMVNPDDEAAHLVSIGAGNGLREPAGGYRGVSRGGRAGNNSASAI